MENRQKNRRKIAIYTHIYFKRLHKIYKKAEEEKKKGIFFCVLLLPLIDCVTTTKLYTHNFPFFHTDICRGKNIYISCEKKSLA